MTKRGDTLWENGVNCVTLLALAISNTPFFPRDVKNILTPIIISILILNICFYSWKQSHYSGKELEREKQDERNRMIQTQAVWCCHVAEDWILLGAFVVFGLFVQNEAVTYTLMWVLVARSLAAFGIRWWLSKKY